MNWTKQEIQVRYTKTGATSPRRAFVSEDGLFGIYKTYPNPMIAALERDFTVCHVPSGFSLSARHSNQRNAELFAAIWRALPIRWERKGVAAIKKDFDRMPVELKRWVNEVKG